MDYRDIKDLFLWVYQPLINLISHLQEGGGIEWMENLYTKV